MKKELDIFQWNDYVIFRILENKPFPSPRVWNSNRRIISDFLIKDPYDKSYYFPDDFPEINSQIRVKYNNKFTLSGDNKQIAKADGSIGKTDSFINIFKENKPEIASCKISLDLVLRQNSFEDQENHENLIQEIQEGINKIYEICTKLTMLDVGFLPGLDNKNLFLYEKKINAKTSWERINTNLEIYASKEKNPLLLVYKYIEKEFQINVEEIELIGQKVRDKFWLIKLFHYSFNKNNLKIIFSTITDEEIVKETNIQEDKEKLDPQNTKIQNIDYVKADSDDLNKIPQFQPSAAIIPEGYNSTGSEIDDLKFALNNPTISIRSFFNDLEFLRDGIWSEETLFCKAFNEILYSKMIIEFHRYSLAQLSDMKAEELKKAERKGAGIGGLFGMVSSGGAFAPLTAVLGANIGKMYVNNIDRQKPIKNYLPDPMLLFSKDEGSFTSLKNRYSNVFPKRRICIRKKIHENNKIYWECFPMIIFSNWVTPAQIFKLENEYYLRPISANLTKNDSVKLGYNPIKMRRSFSYVPNSADIASITEVFSTKIIGETIEKAPTIYKLKLKDDSSFTHYYFDYANDGQIF